MLATILEAVLYGVVLNSDDNFVNIDLGRNGIFEGYSERQSSLYLGNKLIIIESHGDYEYR